MDSALMIIVFIKLFFKLVMPRKFSIKTRKNLILLIFRELLSLENVRSVRLIEIQIIFKCVCPTS